VTDDPLNSWSIVGTESSRWHRTLFVEEQEEVFDSITVYCGVAPEDRSLKFRERSNVHEIIGDDRKVMFSSTVDNPLPRWPGNESISVQRGGWMVIGKRVDVLAKGS
jgi:hypothetical protein